VELKKRLKASGSGEKRWNLSYPETGSFFRVISSEKKGQSGPRPHMALLDEIHEFPDGNIIEMLRAGFKFRRQPLSFMITNSGSDKSSVCWEYHDLGAKVAAGVVENEEFFSFICSLDEEDLVDDRFLDDESCWIKANPSLDAGIPGYDYIRQQVQEARGLPSKMATVKRLCFCVWVAADNPWLSGELWFGCQQSGGIPESILTGRKCWGGLDLSSTQDLTAFALLFEPGYVEQEFIEMEIGKGSSWQPCERKFDPFWRLKCWFWIPGDNLLAKENIDHVPYTVWRDKGYLTALPGRAINKSSVVKLIAETSRKFDLQGIAFDRAKIKDLDEFAEKSGVELTFGSWNREKRQWDWEPGDGIRMMPFGQESRSMDPAISKFEGMLSSKGEIVENNPALLHDGNPVLTWCAANAVTIEDEDKNRKLSKKKSTGRIDGIISAVMACGVSESNATGKSVFDGKDKETIKRMLRGEE
jgi:phage terminase large subunit-like protein